MMKLIKFISIINLFILSIKLSTAQPIYPVDLKRIDKKVEKRFKKSPYYQRGVNYSYLHIFKLVCIKKMFKEELKYNSFLYHLDPYMYDKYCFWGLIKCGEEMVFQSFIYTKDSLVAVYRYEQILRPLVTDKKEFEIYKTYKANFCFYGFPTSIYECFRDNKGKIYIIDSDTDSYRVVPIYEFYLNHKDLFKYCFYPELNKK